jgi:hypothetical protein
MENEGGAGQVLGDGEDPLWEPGGHRAVRGVCTKCSRSDSRSVHMPLNSGLPRQKWDSVQFHVQTRRGYGCLCVLKPLKGSHPRW